MAIAKSSSESDMTRHGPSKGVALASADLERIRSYRNEPVNITKIREADLSPALVYLPAELHNEAEERIREALRMYLMSAAFEREPSEAVLARYFRALEAQGRELARLLLYEDNIEPDYWSAAGVVPSAAVEELCLRIPPHLMLRHEEFSWLLARLARLCTAANYAAEKNESQKKSAGRPPGSQVRELLTYLQPLWERASNPAGFVDSCLGVIGERRGREAIRKAIARLGQNVHES
jgi:hypothetical protein